MIFYAWLFEGDGWCSYPIEASTIADAESIAHDRFQGTRDAWTLKVEGEDQ